MKYPSKRVAEIAHNEKKRLAAFYDNDVAAFTAAVTEIARLEAEPDMYECVCCGEEFCDEPHVDLLVASILVFGEDGTVIENEDYGILATEQEEAGRRFKFCAKCVKKWSQHPLAYARKR